MQALTSLEETQIKSLNLGYNESWWNDTTLRAPLLDFVKRQTCLVTLDLSWAYLSPSATVDILQCLCQDSNVATLEEINMYHAFDFSLDEAC